MKRRTAKLLGSAFAAYLLLLVVLRSIISEATTPTVTLLALPLVLFVVVIALGLADQATAPASIPRREAARTLRGRDVQSLTKQVDVATRSSSGYFDAVLRSHLRELLAERVSLETGIERETVRRTLADSQQGPRLLRDPEIYALLYYTPPQNAHSRLQMLREIIGRIEGWRA